MLAGAAHHGEQKNFIWHAGLTNADQRITEDVEKFAFTVADLFSYTFKPLLDVILFTRSLSRIIGYKPQVWLARA